MKKIKKVVRYDEYGYDLFLHVRAPSKHDVLAILDDAGYDVDGHSINSPYDCTGQVGCYSIKLYDITWSKSRKCYVVKQRHYFDI